MTNAARRDKVNSDIVVPPELPQEEKENIKKEAYKEAVKEVYKEKIKADVLPQTDSLASEESNGIKEQKKETSKKKALIAEKVDQLVIEKELILLRAYGVFPFQLFPGTLIIDLSKVTIIRRQFFAVAQVETIFVKDVFRAEVTLGVFLSSLTITFLHTPVMEKMQTRVGKLKRDDAIKAKTFIDGLALAHSEGLDLSVLSYKEMLNTIKKLGKDKPIEEVI